MANIVTKPAEPTAAERVADAIPTQGQFAVLHDEPRHKVEAFTEELKGRRVHRVLLEMRPAVRDLLASLLERIEQAALEEPNQKAREAVGMIDFLDVRWTQEGRLVMLLGPGGRRSWSEENHREGIDELVAEVLARTRPMLPWGTPESLAVLASAVVDQFAAAEKHQPALDLREVRFERTRWVGPELTVDITHRGQPLRPMVARFW